MFLNRTSAPQVVSFLGICFKQGVIDAYTLGDDMGVKEFIKSHKEPWTYGVLGKTPECDWQMFRVYLYNLARLNHLSGFAENFIFRIRRKDYIWCLLPYCMRFYLMGMEEWVAYPNPAKIGMFLTAKRTHWDPNIPIKKFTTIDIINTMQEIAGDYRKIPDEDRPIGAATMDGFVDATYNLTRKYNAKKRFRWSDLEKQDL